jgi:hypothetical protein
MKSDSMPDNERTIPFPQMTDDVECKRSDEQYKPDFSDKEFIFVGNKRNQLKKEYMELRNHNFFSYPETFGR